MSRPFDLNTSEPGVARAQRTFMTQQLAALAEHVFLLRLALAAPHTAIGFWSRGASQSRSHRLGPAPA